MFSRPLLTVLWFAMLCFLGWMCWNISGLPSTKEDPVPFMGFCLLVIVVMAAGLFGIWFEGIDYDVPPLAYASSDGWGYYTGSSGICGGATHYRTRDGVTQRQTSAGWEDV